MGDGRRIAINAAFMFLKQVVMAVLGIVFVGYMARAVGVSAWGEFQASLSIASIVTLVAGIGVRAYLGREVAVRHELGPRHLGSALLIRGATGAVILGVTMICNLVGRSGLGATLLVLAALSQLANLLYSTMWLSFEAHERFEYILYVELIARLFVIGLAAILLAAGFGVVAAATAFLLGNVLELGITWYFLRTRFYAPVFNTSNAELWRIARASVPIGLVGVLGVALQECDRVLLRVLADERAVGVYSAAWVLSENFRTIADLFLGVAYAAGMRLYARDPEAFKRLFRNCVAFALILGLPVGAGVFLIAPDVIRLIYGDRAGFEGAATVLRILACQVPFTFVYMVATLPLIAAKRERVLVQVLGAALVANVIGNLILIPRYHEVGSAFATLLVSAAILTTVSLLSARWLRLVSIARVAGALGATALMYLAAWNALALGGMWAAIAVAMPVYVVLLFAVRAVSREELAALRRPA
ncbi:flippase [Sorangium sp. So ce367]|uniref:flippase n=1 Tax=Sorangium sp. So ce367 TaxID=3133305 RepID=UPI003F620D0B